MHSWYRCGIHGYTRLVGAASLRCFFADGYGLLWETYWISSPVSSSLVTQWFINFREWGIGRSRHPIWWQVGHNNIIRLLLSHYNNSSVPYKPDPKLNKDNPYKKLGDPPFSPTSQSMGTLINLDKSIDWNIFTFLAQGYRIEGDDQLSLCEFNAEVSSSF